MLGCLGMRPGDVLVLATDGVDAGFADSLELSGSSQTISERILADHWKPPDDALVIVVRYLGVRP
jgi:phosphoserine phosphatase RsbX